MKTSRTQRTNGFTLIELLVVVSIIGVLIAMLLPAIAAVRAASQTTLCMNNLRQLGLGTINYENTYSNYPQEAYRDLLQHTTVLPQNQSVFVMIAPFIETSNDMPTDASTAFNWAYSPDLLPMPPSQLLLCAARRSGMSGGLTDYAAAQNFPLPGQLPGHPVPPLLSVLGAQWLNYHVPGQTDGTLPCPAISAQDVSNGNGLSNTIMLAHKGMLAGQASNNAYVGLLQNGSAANVTVLFDGGFYQRTGLWYSFDHNRKPGLQYYFDGTLGLIAKQTTIGPPIAYVDLNCFSTPHPTCMPALFVDGTVRKIGNIDPNANPNPWSLAWYWNNKQSCVLPEN